MGGNISKSHSSKINNNNNKTHIKKYSTTNKESTFSQSSISNPKKKTSNPVIVLHDSHDWEFLLEDCRRTNKLMVVDFSASWCGPCHYMEPIINDFAKIYIEVVFVKIDVDELNDVASEFGIDAMPTFILIRDGKEVDKVVGAIPEELENMIQKHRF